MLARLAENLFWAGRYLERAEDTARMADVTYHTLLESPGEEIDASWTQLLEVLHVRDAYGDQPLEAARVLAFLVLEPDNPGSVTASVARARENARSVRELISSELWEVVNDLHLSLRSRDLRRDLAEQPWELMALVRRSCLTVYGVASETMPRDDAWRFMALGRLLERAEMTCRLIDVRFGHLEVLGTSSRRLADDPDRRLPLGAGRRDFHHWVAMLKSASCFEAYRRRYRSSMDPVDVVEFLLLAPDLPRSVLFSLTSAQRQLEGLTDTGGSRAARRLGRAAAELQYRDVGELFELDLHHFLGDVQQRVASVADEVADEFFRHAPGGGLHAVATS
jgi:uncharacterized alpha-E superfamily protein